MDFTKCGLNFCGLNFGLDIKVKLLGTKFKGTHFLWTKLSLTKFLGTEYS